MIVFDSRNQVDETKDIKHQTLYYIIYRYVRCSEETEKHHIKNYRLERCLPNTGHTINKQLNPNTYIITIFALLKQTRAFQNYVK